MCVTIRFLDCRGQSQRCSFFDNVLGNGGVHFGRSRRGNPHQLVVAGNEVSILAEIANYQLSSLADCRPSRDRAQLPCEVVG